MSNPTSPAAAAAAITGDEPHHLRRQLRLRDLVLTQILCVVGSSWVGVASGLGRAQTVTWIAAMLLFYVPMGASVIGLNSRLPLEGGLYVWAREAFGDLFGFLTAWNIWVYGIVVTATILYAIPTELAYLIGPSAAWLPENRIACFIILSVIVLALAWSAARGLDLGKWIHNIGGASILFVYAALILLPVFAILTHHLPAARYAPLAFSLPARDLRSFALFGQMLFGALCGLEYVAILAGESQQPAHTIGRSVWLSSPIICAMFVLGTSSVSAFVPQNKIDFIAPIPQTLRLAFGHTGIGSLFAAAAILALQFRLLGAASFIFSGVTRLPMTVGWRGIVPQWFTRLSPRRMPANSIWATAGVVWLLLLLASLGVHAQEAFQLLTNSSLTHYELAYLSMFAIPWLATVALRRTLPAWLKWTSAVGFCSTLFSLLISAYPFVDVVDARVYAIKIIGVTLISNLVGVSLYFVRGRRDTQPAVTPLPA